MLKRILANQKEAASLLVDVFHMMDKPVAVRDLENNFLVGFSSVEPDEIQETHPILCDGEIIGWASGGDPSKFVANLLTYLVAREAEQEELLDEVLALYRQINLLFNLSEKLAASLELETVSRIALDEACRLIQATEGAVILLNEDDATVPAAMLGKGMSAQLDPEKDFGIVGVLVADAKAEIINDVGSDERHREGIAPIPSLLCAPLVSKNKSIGALIIGSRTPVHYTAADLNLLNTLASQAAPAIENAQLFERALREAQEREQRLLLQVQELRIELDEVRQQEKVAEITGSDYYQRLRDRADTLRRIIGESSTE